jgi:hypothetical protein
MNCKLKKAHRLEWLNTQTANVTPRPGVLYWKFLNTKKNIDRRIYHYSL